MLWDNFKRQETINIDSKEQLNYLKSKYGN